MKKKTIWLLAAALSAFVLTSCGTNKEVAKNEQAVTTQPEIQKSEIVSEL